MSGKGGADGANLPLVSIVTATFNVRHEFLKTATSIRRQTYKQIEWIVIDGASTDGTVDLLRSNSDIIAYWASAPDEGIYDAWNKACARATGDWLLFLGAGDELTSDDVLERCAPHLNREQHSHDIVYGTIQLVTPAGETVAEIGRAWPELKGRWGGILPLLPPHPSSFHHRRLFRGSDSFDKSYRYAGDSLFVARSVLERDPLFIPIVVDRMLAEGITGQRRNILKVAAERRRVAKVLPVKAPRMHVVAWNILLAAQWLLALAFPKGVRHKLRRVRAQNDR